MEKIMWIDRFGKEYTKENINNNYLISIINYIKRGGYGYRGFATNEVVKTLVYEAYNRGLYSEPEAESILLDITDHRIEIEDFRAKVIAEFFRDFADVKDLNKFDAGEA